MAGCFARQETIMNTYSGACGKWAVFFQHIFNARHLRTNLGYPFSKCPHRVADVFVIWARFAKFLAHSSNMGGNGVLIFPICHVCNLGNKLITFAKAVA